MAEMEGFELSKPGYGLHDFQSCALGQLGDISVLPKSLVMIPYLIHKMQVKFKKI